MKYLVFFFIGFGLGVLQAQPIISKQQVLPGQLWNDS